MSCESYTEWQDRLHPKVVWFFIDQHEFIRSIALPDNTERYTYTYIDYSDFKVGIDINPNQITQTIHDIRLKPFIARDNDDAIYFRCLATSKEQAELIHKRLEGYTK